MDIIGFLNDVTGGELLLWKVIATTIVLALSGVQVALAARFWGKSAFPAISEKSAVRLHRWNGRVALLLAMVVALSCIAGPAGPTSPTRVVLHSVFGTAVFVVLALKFMLIKVLRSGDRYLPLVGSTLFLVFLAIWATSVADYVQST